MKKFAAAMLAGVMALSMTACGSREEPPSVTSSAATPSAKFAPVRVMVPKSTDLFSPALASSMVPAVGISALTSSLPMMPDKVPPVRVTFFVPS